LKVVRHLIVLVALAAPCGAAWSQPADQVAFVAANEAVQPPAGTRTPMQGIERKIAARDKAVCAAKPSAEIRDWVGVVRANDNEKGVVRVRIAVGHKVEMATWISDFDLRRPTNEKERAHRATTLAFVAMLADIRVGDRVAFSGLLSTGLGKWCYGPANWLIQNRHDEPEYFMRFSKIAKI
jgi:hypothetical protein